MKNNNKNNDKFNKQEDNEDNSLKIKSPAWDLFCNQQEQDNPQSQSDEDYYQNDDQFYQEKIWEPNGAEISAQTSNSKSKIKDNSLTLEKVIVKKNQIQQENQIQKEDQVPPNQAQKSKIREKWNKMADKKKNICLILLAVFVFLLFSSSAAFLLQKKFDNERNNIIVAVSQDLQKIKDDNQTALADVNKRLANIDEQMKNISGILESTDQAILESGAKNRTAMANRINELDKQLAGLKKSLNILMESKGKDAR